MVGRQGQFALMGAALTFLAASFAPTEARSEFWIAEISNGPRTSQACTLTKFARFGFELNGDTFSAGNPGNPKSLFTVKLGPDGKLRQDYKSIEGYRLTMGGEPRTKSLWVENRDSLCRWPLIPEPK